MELLSLPTSFEVRIVRRLNRFVVLVHKEGKLLRAHNTNTGRLKEFLVEGKKAYCIPKSGGKTDCRLFAVEDPFGFAIIDTSLQMKAFEEAFIKGFLPWLKPSRWKGFKRNYRLGNSLIDYLFWNEEENFLLEIKSAAMRSEDNFGMYPDCPTERGRKHLKELLKYSQQAGVLFICALPKVRGFKPYCKGDSEICKLLSIAKIKGLTLKAISIFFDGKNKKVILENPSLEVKI